MGSPPSQATRLLPKLTRLSKDSLIYGVGGAAARYTGLLLLPIYTRAFSAGEYGILEGVTNLGALLTAVAALGFDGAVPLLYFENDNKDRRRSVFSLWVWVTVLASLVLTLALLIFGDWISVIVEGTTRYSNLFRVGIAALPFTLLFIVFSTILRLSFRPRSYAVLNFSLTTFIAVISIYLVVFTEMGLLGALWGAFIGTVLACLLAAWMVRGEVSLGTIGADAGPLLRKLFRLGLPLVPATVALWVVNFSSTYFLLRIIGSEEAGIYRVGARLAAILGLGVWAFQLAWGPYSLSVAREPEAPRLYSRVATLFSAGALLASLMFTIFAPVLLSFFATSDYAGATPVIGLLCLAAALHGVYYTLALGANLAQRTGAIAWTAITAAGATLLLNTVLIPVWGAVGAALAGFVANAVSAVMVFVLSQRLYPIPFQLGRLLVIWITGSVCVGAVSLVYAAFPDNLWLSFVVGFALTVIFVAILILSRAISLNEIRAGLQTARAALDTRL